MAELATGYISLVASTDQIPKQITAALKQAESMSPRAGTSMGAKMSKTFGVALKAGTATAATAATAALATAMTKGFQRLSAIDDAKGKLEGLGHTTVSQAKIMDSALASVKGTAYGLGDAATIAAGAVAAGIKPGQELTKYLTMTADAASIAGTGLSEMGSILNSVQTGQVAYTDSLNQLADRGIPIYQWLAEEAGVTAGEVKKLASKGKISSEMFFAAIDKNIGGAAQAAGKTVRGSFNNMVAAMGRLGAAAQQPTFERLPGMFTAATTAVDALTPRVTSLAAAADAKVFEEWGPNIKAALDAARDGGALGDLTTTMRGLKSAAEEIAPPVGRIVAELGRASSAVGVGTWQLFLTTLNAAAGGLNMLSPVLSGIATVMERNRTAVTALMAAWVAFKTVPSLVGRISGPVTALTQHLASARNATVGFSGAYRQSVQWMAQANPQMSRAGVHMAVLRANGISASGALNKLKSAGSSVAALFGGPVGMAVTGAALAFTYFSAKATEAKTKAQTLQESVSSLADAHDKLGEAIMSSRGEMSDEVWSAASEGMDAYRKNLRASADSHQTFAESWAASIGQLVTFDWGSLGEGPLGDPDRAIRTEAAINELGLSTEQLTKKMYGSRAEFGTMIHNLRQQGQHGWEAAADLNKLRQEYESQVGVAKRVTPGIGELAEAARMLGDTSASAADKLKALRTAVDALSPARGKVEAMRQYGAAVREAAAAAEGIDSSAFKDDGTFNDLSESGDRLAGVLGDIVDKSLQVASEQGDMAAVARENEKVFASLAASTGQDIGVIRDLFNELGGSVVDVAIQVAGSDEVRAELAAVRKGMDGLEPGKPVELKVDALTEGALQTLDKLGIAWKKTPDGKTIQIDANDKAKAALDLVAKKVTEVGNRKAVPKVDLDKIAFDAKDKTVRAELEALHAKKVSPEANLAIEKLLEGKTISMAELQALDAAIANPKADMDATAVLAKIAEVNRQLDIAAQPRTATITLSDVLETGNLSQTGTPSAVFGNNGPQRADGAIVQYVLGGIAQAEAYANGGLRVIDKPMSADIFAGRGDGTIFAEQETGGEAYIPLAPSKRRRSTDILATVAKMFGLAVVPQDSISATLGAIAGGAVSKLLQAAGADSVTRFADGGVAGDVFRRLAEGQGASQPLTGAPYEWGQVNWGDCSGTASAFARQWAGLDPFGGRTGTAGMAGYFADLGLSPGLGSPGDLQFGWYNGGPGGGHATTRLPTGEAAEMGGANGGGMLGGAAVGPEDPRFTEHAHGKVGPGWQDPGADPGGFVVRPDGTVVPSVPSTGPDSGGDTISGRFGAAASAAVSEQIRDLLGVFGINDSPGVLAGASQLGRGQGNAGTGGGAKRDYEAARLGAKQQYEDEKLRRRQDHDTEMQRLRDDLKAKRIDQAEYDEKTRELKRTFDEQELEKKQEYDRAALEAKQNYDQASRRMDQSRPRVTDPGTQRPAPGEDLGSGAAGGAGQTVEALKAAARSALAPKGWDSGPMWESTDWIGQKESSWKPDARNGQYWGIWQLGDDARAAAGIGTSTDVAEQAAGFAHYVSGRHTDPVQAQKFWEEHGYYDRGGLAHGTGVMAKNVIAPERVLDPRETAAFEEMVAANFRPGAGDGGQEQVIDLLSRMLAVLTTRQRAPQPGRYRDEKDHEAAVRRHERAVIAAGSGGR